MIVLHSKSPRYDQQLYNKSMQPTGSSHSLVDTHIL